jgi:hypothetical protein
MLTESVEIPGSNATTPNIHRPLRTWRLLLHRDVDLLDFNQLTALLTDESVFSTVGEAQFGKAIRADDCSLSKYALALAAISLMIRGSGGARRETLPQPPRISNSRANSWAAWRLRLKGPKTMSINCCEIDVYSTLNGSGGPIVRVRRHLRRHVLLGHCP